VAIGGYSINDYWWIFCYWISIVINGYYINDYWYIFCYCILVIIILVAIGGYSIMDIDDY
jgi:hypothetical protein